MNQPQINDPIAAMQKEVNNSELFTGYTLMDEPEGTVVYHESCDEDIITLEGEEKEFSDVIDEVLKHAAECEADEEDEDDDDIEEIDFEDEE